MKFGKTHLISKWTIIPQQNTDIHPAGPVKVYVLSPEKLAKYKSLTKPEPKPLYSFDIYK